MPCPENMINWGREQRNIVFETCHSFMKGLRIKIHCLFLSRHSLHSLSVFDGSFESCDCLTNEPENIKWSMHEQEHIDEVSLSVRGSLCRWPQAQEVTQEEAGFIIKREE